MTASNSRHTSTPSRREARPRRCLALTPKRGRGERRMPVAPAASCALGSGRNAHEYTSTPESPGIPARNGFNGFLRALPGDRAVLPPSPTDMFLSKPGWADLNSANLTPASGRQDHTTSPYAATSLVRALLIAHRPFANPPCNPVARKTLPRPPHPHPASVTIAIRPSGGVGRLESIKLFLPNGEAKYFSDRGWTLICPTGCFRVTALPSSAIDLHLQSVDIIAVKTRVLSRAATAHAQYVGWVEPAKPIISIRCN